MEKSRIVLLAAGAIAVVAIALFLGFAGQGNKGIPDVRSYRPHPVVADGKVPLVQGDGEAPGAEVACRLLGERTKKDNIPGADLGVVFTHYINGKQYLYFAVGDIDFNPVDTSNALARTASSPGECLDFEWLAHPMYRAKRVAGDDFSTVPAGGISIGGKIYVYMMQVLDWSTGAPARVVLLKSTDDGMSFGAVKGIDWGVSSKSKNNRFVNVAPVMRESDGMVYLFHTGTYRDSPVYLSKVKPNEIGDKSKYLYFTGTDAGGMPMWGGSPADGVPVVQGKIGELSVQWNSGLGKWAMMYYYAPAGGVALRTSDEPWGQWSKPKIVFRETPASMEQFTEYNERTTKCLKGFSECDEHFATIYAPYVLPDEFQTAGDRLYFTISLWAPYTVFLMKTPPLAELPDVMEITAG